MASATLGHGARSGCKAAGVGQSPAVGSATTEAVKGGGRPGKGTVTRHSVGTNTSGASSPYDWRTTIVYKKEGHTLGLCPLLFPFMFFVLVDSPQKELD